MVNSFLNARYIEFKRLNSKQDLLWVEQVILKMHIHFVTLLPLGPKYSLHSLVRSEEVLVFRILQVLLLEVSPQLHDHLRPKHPFFFFGADDLSQLGGDVEEHPQLLSFLSDVGMFLLG